MTAKKNISLLGATGSIGTSTLDVVRQHPERYRLVGLAAGNNIELLARQVAEFEPLLVSVAQADKLDALAALLPASWRGQLCHGPEGAVAVAELAEADTVVSAIVGAAGLLPTMAAVEAGKDVALANKETLVMAGALVMERVRKNGVQLLPVDSEHNAIAQALAAGRPEDVARLILTASGGPFRQWPAERLREVTVEQALNHPNWAMGRKITIDSATLMNKGLEVIEARWLFGIEAERIDVLVHPQSIVHSLVEFIDGSVVAQLGIPDMRLPIAYALAWPERLDLRLPSLNLATAPDLSFLPPDLERFPALALAFAVCRAGGILPAVLNGANEVAVEAFLEHRLSFTGISEVVRETVESTENTEAASVDHVLQADAAARRLAAAAVRRRAGQP